MASYPKVKYVLVGYRNTILTDYFEKYGDYVSYTTDVIFPKATKKGLVLWSMEHVDYIYYREDDGKIILILVESGFKKDYALNFIEIL